MSGTTPRSDGFGIARPAAPDELQPVDPTQLSRYDVLLAVVPAVLTTAWLFGQVAGVPTWAALAAGALAAVPAVADGLLRNPPR